MPARDTHIAPDTLTNRIGFAFAYLLGQEGVGDAGPSATNQIENAPFDLRDHGVRGGKSADTHNRPIGYGSDKVNDRLVGALWAKP